VYRTFRWLLVALASTLMLALLARAGAPAWHARDADALFDGERDAQMAMADGMDRWIQGDLAHHDFRTGSPRFDGEWLFGTYMMAAMGHGQIAIEHPELRAQQASRMEPCIEGMLARESRAFDRAAWGHDPLSSPGSSRAHVAYLGYMNLVLSLHRMLDPDSPYAALNDRVTRHLMRLAKRSRTGLLETYPGEVYPVDNAAFVASVAMHQRATGQDHSKFLAKWFETFEQGYVDTDSGLVVQSVRVSNGHPADAPRGSGTALAAYFLSFANPELSRALHGAIEAQLAEEVAGFGVVREYPRGTQGRGDIDSGPIIFGWGLSPTGFALASSRAHTDRERYRAYYATAHLFGVPVDRVDANGQRTRNFATGGPIGDALMFALLTAQPADTWEVVQ
jgi:hypothetical protein